MNELTISVTIAERPYRLTIKREEEEVIRKATNEINKKIKEYSDNFAFNDMQDLIAMVILEFSTKVVNFEEDLKSNDNTTNDKLVELDMLLSNSLKNK
ncbi:MAG: cell division protein ZapA [Bacteroidetes bacterium]|nr:MAG: cell division protein ZapA [Bacteroidota bacterium]